MSEAHLSVAEVMAALGAVLVLDQFAGRFHACPVCGAQRPTDDLGPHTLCLPCTIDEVGATPHDLAVCRVHGISMKRWHELDCDERNLPSVTYATWRKRAGR